MINSLVRNNYEFNTQTDEHILIGIKSGIEYYENLFYLKYRDRLVRYAERICRDIMKAEDLVQDTVIVTLFRLREGRIQIVQEGHLLNSMKRTLKNIYNNHLRKEKKWMYNSNIDMSIIELEESQDMKELLFETCEKALGIINEKCHDIILAVYYERLSMKEISNRFNNFKTARSVTTFKYKCKEKLKSIVLELLKSE